MRGPAQMESVRSAVAAVTATASACRRWRPAAAPTAYAVITAATEQSTTTRTTKRARPLIAGSVLGDAQRGEDRVRRPAHRHDDTAAVAGERRRLGATDRRRRSLDEAS